MGYGSDSSESDDGTEMGAEDVDQLDWYEDEEADDEERVEGDEVLDMDELPDGGWSVVDVDVRLEEWSPATMR